MELKRLTICLMTMVIAGPFMLATAAEPANEADRSQLRVGVFDSRAVACAWYRSKAHMKQINEMKAAYEKAKANGDTKRAAELENKGREVRKLHTDRCSATSLSMRCCKGLKRTCRQ